MGTQSFRGAGGAGAVRTSGTQLATTPGYNNVTTSGTDEAPTELSRDGRRRPRGRGWVLSLDVERRLREVRAHVRETANPASSLDDSDDVALIRACWAGL